VASSASPETIHKFRSGRAALLKAQNAGVFAKLPPDKYEGWRLIHVTFTPDKDGIGFST